jgi:transcriptional regulator with XRE-family HTH domain
MRIGDGVALGQLVRDARERAGLSQTALAARANVQRPWLSRLEAGKGNPTFDVLIRLLEAVGLIVDVHPPASARIVQRGDTHRAPVTLDELVEGFTSPVSDVDVESVTMSHDLDDVGYDTKLEKLKEARWSPLRFRVEQITPSTTRARPAFRLDPESLLVVPQSSYVVEQDGQSTDAADDTTSDDTTSDDTTSDDTTSDDTTTADVDSDVVTDNTDDVTEETTDVTEDAIARTVVGANDVADGVDDEVEPALSTGFEVLEVEVPLVDDQLVLFDLRPASS